MLTQKLVSGRRPDVYIPGQATHAHILRYWYLVPLIKPPGLPVYYLLNEVHVKIKLVRSRNSFCLIAANEFKVKIDSAIMLVEKSNCRRPCFWHTLKHWRTLPRNIPHAA